MVPTTRSFRLVFAVLLLAFLVQSEPTPALGGEDDEARTVAKGGVGESGPTAMLQHQVKGKKRRLVLSTATSSLCGNTGVVAMLVVNGTPKVHGVLTKPESSIEVRASPGDRVIAIAHTIPLHNGIECLRLGELMLELSERTAAD